ncbi:carboxypeptidase-like regulatory domain-containing protein [Hymenobacter wooponensis]|uniref:Carboxypeptidase regulatory-like domain-containing protein n=1 Tax=Hymenobacter wooponensis TaxID=1525360 RepID=A0A4Z0MLQ0_9BACT|nr:carboxypeptidase-like regulatory domain-containing protein [Hymenobacter wooponensis]TGD80772.1 carboxypeptidase regulatory-like domain-containing protein [Hymenobacter wooponensis]
MKTSFASCTLLGLSLLFTASVLPAQAQSGQRGSLTGRLFDGQTQEPIPHANVVLLRASDNFFVKSVETDAKGVFRAGNLPLGQYKFRTTVLGYQAVNPKVAFHARQTHVALGSVVMVPLNTPRVTQASKLAWAQRSSAVAGLEPLRPALRVRS